MNISVFDRLRALEYDEAMVGARGKTYSGKEIDAWIERIHSDEYQQEIKEDRKDGCAVYVIYAPSMHVKIGIAKNVKTRLNQLQTAHWEELKVARIVRYSETRMAQFTEMMMHRELATYNVRGEWFKLPGHLLWKLLKTTWHPFNKDDIFTRPTWEEAMADADAALQMGLWNYYGIQPPR